MRSLFGICVASLLACAPAPAPRQPPPTPAAAPAVIAEADAGSAPLPETRAPREIRRAVPTTTCALPARLVQGASVHDDIAFRGDVLASDDKTYDAEHLAPLGVPPPPAAQEEEDDFVTLAAGLRAESTGGKVTEVATGRVVFEPAHPCAAGGYITFSLSNTGRYLRCDSNREGLALWDLRVPHDEPETPPTFAKNGLRLAPNDAYAVEAPVEYFGSGKLSGAAIVYHDLAHHTARPLADAPTFDRENPYDVAFCGDGAIFAVSEEHELAIHRGSDGKRVASAPSKRGGRLTFSASGRYLSQTRSGWTTIYKLLP